MPVTKVYANMLCMLNAGRMDSERLIRIVEAGSVSAAFKMLGDYGYTLTDGTVDGFIVAETNALIAFVEENAASESVKKALLAPFVYNNAKLAYKSRFVDIPADAYYDVALDTAKIKDGDYSECDGTLTAAFEALDEAGESSPQSIDLAITRAMYAYVLKCGDALIRRYFRAEIDMKNILSAARMRRLGVCRDEFIGGGNVKRETLERSLTEQIFAEAFENTPYAELAANAEKDGLWRFERETDDHLFLMTKSMCENMTSYKPFLNYYTRTRIELKAIKTALVCLKTDSRELFYERMPRIYG